MPEATQAQLRAEQLLNALWNDHEVGERVRKAAKSQFPDAKIVDDVVAPFVEPLRAQNEALSKRLTEMQDRIDADRAEREKQATQIDFEQKLSQARQNYSLTDEGFDKMVARMKETGNYVDPDAAAAWVASKNPPAPPKGPTWSPQDLDLFGSKNRDDSLEKLHRDPIGFQDDVLSEFFRNPDKFVQESMGG